MRKYTTKEVQVKILETMTYVDALCRQHGIDYYIMGGTAIGAVRHGGFIPWDDDLDIFMTPANYEKFKSVFTCEKDERFALQEWRLGSSLMEYAKVRMNGTAFIEANFKDRADMHHGVYVDIMILHRCPKNRLAKSLLFLCSRFVMAQGLSERNWKPKTRGQAIALKIVRMLPKHFMSAFCFRQIYKYDNQQLEDYEYCYFLTKSGFERSIYPKVIFDKPVEVPFENTRLLGPTDIHGYLKIRFGDYMKLPPENEREAAAHAEIVDLEKDYKQFFV